MRKFNITKTEFKLNLDDLLAAYSEKGREYRKEKKKPKREPPTTNRIY